MMRICFVGASNVGGQGDVTGKGWVGGLVDLSVAAVRLLFPTIWAFAGKRSRKSRNAGWSNAHRVYRIRRPG